MFHVKQTITKFVNFVFLINNEHRRCSFVADATSETLNAQGSCSEKDMSLVNSKDLRKMTECQDMSKNMFYLFCKPRRERRGSARHE